MTGIREWGAVMRLARRASLLAGEEQRRLGRVTEQEDSSIMLYTDDPTTAGLFVRNSDMAVVCKTSAIEGVCIVMGDKFPPAAHEAERDDTELPRVAAMWFPAPGNKCPRCRLFRWTEGEVCNPCEKTLAIMKIPPPEGDGGQ